MFDRFLSSVMFLVVLLGFTSFIVSAQSVCETYWDPIQQSWVTVCSEEGGGSSGGGGGGEDTGNPGENCSPGTTIVSTVIIGGGGLCEVWEIWHDACTGQLAFANLVNVIEGGSCTAGGSNPGGAPQENPCIVLTVSSVGVYCQTAWGVQWALEASVKFPFAHLDLRPYPVTLVQWPSAVRNGGTPEARGVGRLDYIPFGGGEEDDPELGDWDNVRLILTLSPASPVMFFSMPTVGTIALPDVGENGLPQRVVFEQPSHPEAGAITTAGDIGLDGVPADFPVFSGSAVTAYRLYWRLSYDKYVRECKSGPNSSTGGLECKMNRNAPLNDGHWEYRWKRRGEGGEITPQMVLNLQPHLSADLDGDGLPDAFWNRKVNVRRMDENNRIDNPTWAGSWHWGGAVYWAVREGQGQIGFP